MELIKTLTSKEMSILIMTKNPSNNKTTAGFAHNYFTRFLYWGFDAALHCYRFYLPDNRFYLQMYLASTHARYENREFVSPFGNKYLTIGLFDSHKANNIKSRLLKEFKLTKRVNEKIIIKANTDKDIYNEWIKLRESGKSFRGVIRTNKYFESPTGRVLTSQVVKRGVSINKGEV